MNQEPNYYGSYMKGYMESQIDSFSLAIELLALFRDGFSEDKLFRIAGKNECARRFLECLLEERIKIV